MGAPLPYQYKREPLLPEEATRLAQACQSVREKLVIWTLLDTGLRVAVLIETVGDSGPSAHQGDPTRCAAQSSRVGPVSLSPCRRIEPRGGTGPCPS